MPSVHPYPSSVEANLSRDLVLGLVLVLHENGPVIVSSSLKER